MSNVLSVDHPFPSTQIPQKLYGNPWLQLFIFSKFNMKETTEQYYERCHHVTKEILKRHRHEGRCGRVAVNRIMES